MNSTGLPSLTCFLSTGSDDLVCTWWVQASIPVKSFLVKLLTQIKTSREVVLKGSHQPREGIVEICRPFWLSHNEKALLTLEERNQRYHDVCNVYSTNTTMNCPVWLSHVPPDIRVGHQFSKYGLGTPSGPWKPFRGNWSHNHFHSNTIILFVFLLSWHLWGWDKKKKKERKWWVTMLAPCTNRGRSTKLYYTSDHYILHYHALIGKQKQQNPLFHLRMSLMKQ